MSGSDGIFRLSLAGVPPPPPPGSGSSILSQLPSVPTAADLEKVLSQLPVSLPSSGPVDPTGIAGPALRNCWNSSDVAKCVGAEVPKIATNLVVSRGLAELKLPQEAVQAAASCLAKGKSALECGKDVALNQGVAAIATAAGVSPEAIAAAKACWNSNDGNACIQAAATAAVAAGCVAVTGGIGAPLCGIVAGPVAKFLYDVLPPILRGPAAAGANWLKNQFKSAWSYATGDCYAYMHKIWLPVFYEQWVPIRENMLLQTCIKLNELRAQLGLTLIGGSPSAGSISVYGVGGGGASVVPTKCLELLRQKVAFDAKSKYGMQSDGWEPAICRNEMPCTPESKDIEAAFNCYHWHLNNFVMIPFVNALREFAIHEAASANAEHITRVMYAQKFAAEVAAKRNYVLQQLQKAAAAKTAALQKKQTLQQAAALSAKATSSALLAAKDKEELLKFASLSLLVVAAVAGGYVVTKKRRKTGR